MKVAILGSGLMARSIADVADFYLFPHSAIEITDPASVDKALRGFDVAINTVAHHPLGKCEQNPAQAHAVNADGAANVGRVTRQIYISTDYVFCDGPVDEVMPGEQPRNVYGQSKLAGEVRTLEHGGTVVRIAAVFGHYDSHKGPSFTDRVLSGRDPLKLPNDQRFSPTYAPDAAQRIVALALDSSKVGVYHATNAGSTTWAEFAQNIVEETGIARKVTGYAAHDPLRPKNSVLRSRLLPPLRHWRAALTEWWAVDQAWRQESA